MRTLHARLSVLAVAIALLLLPVLATAETLSGKVVGISDGDTLTLLVESAGAKRTVKIRLHGIDCPEAGQAFGSRAKQFASELAFSKAATVEVTDTDKYGRTVGIVKVGPKTLNHELVKAGLAWWFRRYAPKDKVLAQLETDARLAGVGLWADKSPTPPWDYRHGPAPAAAPTITRTAPPVAENVSAQVYVTRTGAKFHRDGCRYLARSRIPATMKDAQAQGLTACSVCRP